MIRHGVLLAVALAGCTPGPPAVPPAGRQFDGAYAGQDVLQSGVDFQCGDQNLTERLVIRDGRFDYPFQVNPPRTAPLPVQIGIDGSVFGQMQYGTEDSLGLRTRYRTDWVTLQGQIRGDTLDATLTNYRCVRHLTARRN
ncbi:MAG: hypothetical protein WDN25_05250 [Acetobacteraceae bacterium]